MYHMWSTIKHMIGKTTIVYLGITKSKEVFFVEVR